MLSLWEYQPLAWEWQHLKNSEEFDEVSDLFFLRTSWGNAIRYKRDALVDCPTVPNKSITATRSDRIRSRLKFAMFLRNSIASHHLTSPHLAVFPLLEICQISNEFDCFTSHHLLSSQFAKFSRVLRAVERPRGAGGGCGEVVEVLGKIWQISMGGGDVM
jgi:hypothetical protein